MGFNSGFKGLINIGIINSSKELLLVGYFYMIYNEMHGSMNVNNPAIPRYSTVNYLEQ